MAKAEQEVAGAEAMAALTAMAQGEDGDALKLKVRKDAKAPRKAPSSINPKGTSYHE